MIEKCLKSLHQVIIVERPRTLQVIKSLKTTCNLHSNFSLADFSSHINRGYFPHLTIQNLSIKQSSCDKK